MKEVVVVIIGLERQMKTKYSGRIAGNLPEIWTEFLPNTKSERNSYTKLVSLSYLFQLQQIQMVNDLGSDWM